VVSANEPLAIADTAAMSALQRAQEEVRFQAKVIAAAGQAVVAVDLDRVITYWSEGAVAMYGWSKEEAIGRSSVDLLPRDESSDRLAAIYGLLRRGRSWSGEYELRRRDGSLLTAYITNTPLFADSGRLSGVIGVAVDITEQRQREKLVGLLSAIVDGSGDAIIGVSIDGSITTWNAAAAQLFGHTAIEAVGQPISLIATGDGLVEQAGVRRRLLGGGPPERLETVRRRKDGTDLEVLLTTSTIKDASGAVIGLSVIAQDITERMEAQREVESSRKRLAESQRNAQLGSFEFDARTGTLSWSDEYFRIVGVDRSVVPSTALFMERVHVDDRAGVIDAWTAALVDGTSFDLQFRICRVDGERVVRARSAPDRSADGTVRVVAGTFMDETERVEAETVRRAAETRFEIGFEQSTIGAVISGMDGIPVRVNRAACVILGREADELTGRRWTTFTHPDEVALGLAARAAFEAGGDTYQDDRRYVRPDGSVVWASTSLSVVRDEAGVQEYVFMQLQDITSRKQMEAELAHLALHDSLTGLPNRALLADRLSHGLATSARRGSNLGVIFLDVDRFKVINDSMGHSAGDELLSHVARRIGVAVRDGDTVARFGGDEFVVVCADVTSEEVDLIAARILDALAVPLRIGHVNLEVTASLGVAVAEEGSTPESLLRDSDAAMYRAKERGRGRIERFDQAMRSSAEDQLTTLSALRDALEHEEFEVHYQPVVDLTDGSLLSVEALARWNRPGEGIVGPEAFIPIAEATGLIVPLGAWVLERACRDLVSWQSIQPGLTVAVNLSARQMLAPNVCEMIHDVLRRTGAPPSDVCLEVTESIFMEDVDYFGQILASIRATGAGVAIDDFGTGYSSLSYLRQFPVDGVKIDRVFVGRLGDSPHDVALVAAIVALAGALDLEVTAEGIETHEQFVALRRLGVRRAQGFYFARPMAASTIDALVRDRHMWTVA
jgi:diguanylate cyclase (GGDEF)-like protein/PAS domain S-box-containing protein